MTPGMLAHDCRIAARGLLRARGFTAATVLTLTIGIAGTTVMFALINGVLLRPLPVRDQDELLVAWKELRLSAFAHYPFGGPDVEAVAASGGLFIAAAGVTSNGAPPVVAIEEGRASYVNAALVTGRFFDVLGVEAALGRTLAASDDVDGAEAVVVISHALWHRRYGGSPDAVGRRLEIGGLPLRIVGVAARGFEYPKGAELWRPVRSIPRGGTFGDAPRYEVDLIARMRRGVTIEQAEDALRSLTSRLASTAPTDLPRGLVPVVRSLEDAIVGGARAPMLLLFAAVGLVLLIASANAANLLLLRSEGRRREMIVRAALGASRGRIASQVLAESLMLAAAAGAAGVILSRAGLGVLIASMPRDFPRVDAVRVDATVILFTAGAAFGTALLTAIVPAMSAWRADLAGSLRSVRASARALTGRRALVVAQVALAVVVVAASGLLLRSLSRLRSADLGFRGDRILIVDLALPPAKVMDPKKHERLLDDLMTQMNASPLIAAATPLNVPPFSGDGGWDVPRFTAEGQSPERAATNPSLNLESIHPSYFETFEIPIVRGRRFTAADRAGAPLAAIVSADVAEKTWPGEDPIGKRLKMGGPSSEYDWLVVVGVAAPTRYRDLASARATLYLPAQQFLMTARLIAVRSPASLDAVTAAVREAVPRADAQAQVVRVTPFTALMNAPLAAPRFHAQLLTVFGVSALVLATVGLYAVIAANVRLRSREIGIRLALGASRGDVRRLVVNDGLRLSAAGAATGLLGALAATRVVRSLLFEVDPLDPAALTAAVLLLMAASVAASYIPMRRAARTDPAITLRAE